VNLMELVTELNEKGIALSLKGAELVVRGEEDVLDDTALRTRLREHKAPLIELLQSGKYAGPGSAGFVAPANRIPPRCDLITPEMLSLVQLSAADIERIVSTVPGGAANVLDIYPLAPLQEGILFHHLASDEGDPYLLHNAYSFDSRARLDAFVRATQAVIDRHDILRTAVLWDGLPEPVQVVWRHAPLIVEEFHADPAAGDVLSQLQSRFDPAHYRIDVRQAPLMRFCIAEDRARDRWIVLFLNHHLAGDHTTLEVMKGEIRAQLLGEAAQLPAPLPFRDFVARTRMGVSREEHEAFFRDMLSDVDEATVPLGLSNVQGDGSYTTECWHELDAKLGERLRRQARLAGVGPASLFHLAWALVLAKLSEREDVVFGTVLFGRMHAAAYAERAVGMFINTLPIRLRVGEGGVLDGVRATHDLLTRLMRHEHASLTLAQRCSGVEAPRPLFTAFLNFRHSPDGEQTRGAGPDAWAGVEMLGGTDRTNYPFNLNVDDLGKGFSLHAQVQTPFDPKRICCYTETALTALVQALERTPAAPLHGLDILPEDERRQLLVEWNATSAAHQSEVCVHALFEEQARRSPDAIAVVHEDATLSYSELNRRANRLAHHLRGLGVQPDARVAVCVERSLDMVVGLLAVLKAGGAYVPLDPSYPEERLARMLDDCAPTVVLTDGLAALRTSAAVVDLHTSAARWARQPDTDPDPALAGLTPAHLAYVIYTSGSTGTPKGVMVEHRSLANHIAWQVGSFGFSETDAVLQRTSISFDASVWELWTPLAIGARLVLLPPALERDAAGIARTIADRQVTIAQFVPSLLRLVLQEHEGSEPLCSFLFSGGEPLDAELAARARECARHAFVNLYGPTEATVDSITWRCAEDSVPQVVPIGRPIDNARVYILDRRGLPVPIGAVGEIHIGGAGVARGYWNRPELTTERFLPDPFSAAPGARMYRSGDLGRYLPDGNIEFKGRNDQQVKIRGHRIEPGEIEAALLSHPDVTQAVVLAREDQPGDKRLVAYYVAQDAIDAEALRAHLQQWLPDYMLPAACVAMPALPHTLNGKIDRKALQAPESCALAVRGYEAPRDDVEAVLAQVWCEVLQLERIGRDDHFFDLGGHSLLAIKVASRLRRRIGVEISVVSLFNHPVLKDFAEFVKQAARSELPSVTPVSRDEPLALSFGQSRLWFLARMEGMSQAYHMPFALLLEGRLDVSALQRALDRIVARHEALRTRFELRGELPVQAIGPADTGFLLRHEDLQNDPNQRQVLPRLLKAESAAPFDLDAGPLVRGRLVRLATERHALLVTVHHIVYDGWSLGVFKRELGKLYRAFVEGGADPLPPLLIQYPDYAAWQRRWLSGETLQAQAAYWRNKLSGAPALLQLPTDRPRPVQQDHCGASIGFELDDALSQSLAALSQRHGTTLFMTLLAAWAALLGRLSGQAEVVIGTPVANRMRAEVEPLIGFFVNTVALRVDLSDAPTVETLLRSVKAVALEVQQHQDLPFEQVVEIVNPPRNMAHSPLFQVMFVWQNNEDEVLELPDLSCAPIESGLESTKFDLTLNLGEADGRISGVMEYASALFDRATVERHLAYFRSLLEAMVDSEQQQVAQLPILDAVERERLLFGWNATRVDYALDQGIHELFEKQVAANPDAIALKHEDGTLSEALSYGELNSRANRLARHLRQLGAKRDARIVVCMERGIAMVTGMLAILKSGGAYLPLDPQWPAERIAALVRDSAPLAALVDGSTGTDTARVLEESGMPLVDLGPGTPSWAELPDGDLDRIDAEAPGSCAAYVIYTSGSTGEPKGVINEHGAVVNRLTWMQQANPICAGDTVLQKTPFTFDVSVWEFFWPLTQGARLVMAQAGGHKDPAYLAHVIAQEQVSVMHFVPSMLPAFLDRAEASACSSLKQVVCSGEAFPGALARRFKAFLPHVRLHNLYGPTEAAIEVTAWECAGNALPDNIPIGRPAPNNRIYLLDAHGQPVPQGVAGEIHIGGVQVARGYLNRPELTAARFVPDPFADEPGARMYKTGDLGRFLPNGDIEFLGRNDFQVKIRGVRIELGEIEARLALHPAIRDAVVVARETPSGESRLLAYYMVVDPQQQVDPYALHLHLAAALPEQMIPAAFVALDALPVSANGKLDRQALPEPERDALAVRAYEAPHEGIENRLAALWQDLLQVEAVGRHDDFFRLGGHSLLAVRLIERMRALDLHADVRTLFTFPTLAALAEAAGKGHDAMPVAEYRLPEDCSAISPVMLPLVALAQEEIDRIVGGVPGGVANVQDIYPLAPLQEGILFHHLMQAQGDPYLLQALYRFDSRPRLDAFIGALQIAIDRHDILRTAMHWEELAQPVQVVWRKAHLTVEEVVLDAQGGDLAQQLRARYDRQHYRMDVRLAPMMRLCVAQDAASGRWLVLHLFHHLWGDHTSLDVLLHEIRAHVAGRGAQLPPPLPFRNFVAQARLGVSREEHEAFFTRMLGDIDEVTAPYGLADVQGDGSGIREARIDIDTALAARLKARARKLGVSAASLCHLAWARVLGCISARDDVVFGTVLFGRMQGGEGADRVLGMFINTLPIRLALNGEGVEAGVRRTHALLTELLHHEHAPLALAQRCSGVAAPLPLFGALLNYRHSGAGPAATQDNEDGAEVDGIEMLGGEERTNYPLTLSVDDFGDGLGLNAQAQAPIDPERICAYMHKALEQLVTALEQAPARPLRALDILGADERRLLLQDWNRTEVAYPHDRTIHNLFEEQAQRTPDAVAVDEDGAQLRYAELNAQTNRLARHLHSLGVQPGACVALLLERSAALVVAELAILKCGAAYVPLDQSAPAQRQAFLLADCEAHFVLTLRAHALPEGMTAQRIDLDALDALESEQHDSSNLDLPMDSEAVAAVLYTSGSTGQPKGVLVPHRAIGRLVLNNHYADFQPDDRVAFTANPAFDTTSMEVWGPLLHGAAIVVVDQDTLLDAQALKQRLQDGGVTILHLVAGLLRAHAEALGDVFGQLRTLLTGGDLVDPRSVAAILQRNPPQHLVHCYGPSETATFATTCAITAVEPGAASLPIGRPIANTRIYLLDGNGQPVPQGVAGEIHIGGAGVALGYLKRPELTEERFLPDPFANEAHARMYKTGDLGRYLPDGRIVFLGRNDDQVKLRGMRVEPGEIAARLGQHAAVKEAVVLALGAGTDRQLVAYYTQAAEQAPTDAELRAFLLETLPEYMVPAAFMALDALPLTPNGKLDRRALPQPQGLGEQRAYEVPQGETEIALARIWGEVLQVERVGRHDDFFRLGGHSLLAVSLIERMRREGLHTDVRALFDAPRLAQFAAVTEKKWRL
jgi:arthrofactin-type cyclic lipopeptide synthetase C